MPLTICRLLAALALLGLVLAPLTRSAMADAGSSAPQSHHEMTADMSADAAAMPEGMPCCPDSPPMPDCGKHCLMAMCAASVMSTLPASTSQFLPNVVSHKLAVHQDPALSGVPITPPPKPPRA
jgi:hypothetical protein